jgi:hypothetical protein
MHLILQTIDGTPSFYSLEAGRTIGSLHGWSQERDKALQFEREKDAQGFVNAFLPNVAPFATVVEIKPATAPHDRPPAPDPPALRCSPRPSAGARASACASRRTTW